MSLTALTGLPAFFPIIFYVVNGVVSII